MSDAGVGRMRLGTTRAWALGAVVALSGCDCIGSDSAVPTMPESSSANEPKTWASGTDELDLQPKSVYKKAYDQAHKEVTAQNASARLERMDGQIDREREMKR